MTSELNKHIHHRLPNVKRVTVRHRRFPGKINLRRYVILEQNESGTVSYQDAIVKSVQQLENETPLVKLCSQKMTKSGTTLFTFRLY